MSAHVERPPPIIHSARTLCYAINDDSVSFTNRINLFVGDSLDKLSEMPLLAICENYCPPRDILLFFCSEYWEPEGTIGLESIEAAKAKAEVGYSGISGKWQNVEASEEEIDKFLREVYEVDPETEWWKIECSFCGKDDSETHNMLGKNSTYICGECITAFHEMLQDKGNA